MRTIIPCLLMLAVLGCSNRTADIEQSREKIKLALVNPPVDDEVQITKTCAAIHKEHSTLYSLTYVEVGGKIDQIEEHLFESKDRLEVAAKLDSYLKQIAKKHPTLFARANEDAMGLVQVARSLHSEPRAEDTIKRLGLPNPPDGWRFK